MANINHLPSAALSLRQGATAAVPTLKLTGIKSAPVSANNKTHVNTNTISTNSVRSNFQANNSVPATNSSNAVAIGNKKSVDGIAKVINIAPEIILHQIKRQLQINISPNTKPLAEQALDKAKFKEQEPFKFAKLKEQQEAKAKIPEELKEQQEDKAKIPEELKEQPKNSKIKIDLLQNALDKNFTKLGANTYTIDFLNLTVATQNRNGQKKILFVSANATNEDVRVHRERSKVANNNENDEHKKDLDKTRNQSTSTEINNLEFKQKDKEQKLKEIIQKYVSEMNGKMDMVVSVLRNKLAEIKNNQIEIRQQQEQVDLLS